jgi:hypothetical protein
MAIGKLFDQVGGVIIPKEVCDLLIPLVKMKEAYPSRYLKLIAYCHFMNSMVPADNPYADVDLDERSDQIVKDLELFDIDTENPIIVKAVTCVGEKYFTTFYGIYMGIKTMLDKIGKKFKTVDPDFSSKDGNSAGILSFMKSYEILNKNFKAAYKDFEEETGNVRVRGGGKLAYDEDDD